MEKNKAKKVSHAATLLFRVVSVVAVALVFTIGQQIGELIYYLIS